MYFFLFATPFRQHIIFYFFNEQLAKKREKKQKLRLRLDGSYLIGETDTETK